MHRDENLHLDTSGNVTQADFDRFADISGDHNPIHVDAGYAHNSAFGATVSHGMLLFSRLRGLMARACPGLRVARQELMFPAPSYADEALRFTLDGAFTADGGVNLHTQVHKPDGRLGLDGRAVLVRADADVAVPPAATQSALEPGSPQADAGCPHFSALRAGDRADVHRAYTLADLAAWAELAQMPAPPAAVPEPLIAALYSYLLGERLPGHGTNYLKQSLSFHALAQVDEPLHAQVEITRLRADKALVNLDTRCTGADGRLVCSGQALVLFRR